MANRFLRPYTKIDFSDTSNYVPGEFKYDEVAAADSSRLHELVNIIRNYFNEDLENDLASAYQYRHMISVATMAGNISGFEALCDGLAYFSTSGDWVDYCDEFYYALQNSPIETVLHIMYRRLNARSSELAPPDLKNDGPELIEYGCLLELANENPDKRVQNLMKELGDCAFDDVLICMPENTYANEDPLYVALAKQIYSVMEKHIPAP